MEHLRKAIMIKNSNSALPAICTVCIVLLTFSFAMLLGGCGAESVPESVHQSIPSAEAEENLNRRQLLPTGSEDEPVPAETE